MDEPQCIDALLQGEDALDLKNSFKLQVKYLEAVKKTLI